MSGNRTPIVVGLVAIAFSSLIAVRVLSQVEWDATIFIAFGEEATPTREYAEDRLGEIYLRPEQGHDGKFFYVQSNDPLVVEPEENALVLDRPLYRSQRMLYPVLAGGFGLFGAETIVWSMLVVNLLAMGVGTWVVAKIAMEMGGSPWWGLAFALNLGFISEVNIGGAGVVAAVAAFGAVLCLMRGRHAPAIVLLVVAALSREAMLIAAAGSALWLWMRGDRRRAVITGAAPLVSVAVWAAYLRMRIGSGVVTSQVQEIGWPFVGFIEAFESWVTDPVDLAAGVAMMILFVLFTRRVLITRHIVGVAFVGFVALGLVFTEQVWHSYFDITRAVAPIITSFVLLLFLGTESSRRSATHAMSSSQ
ncbi:MAG: hypothetical protein PVG83_03615 [Acidimicrobiia bacterium]|jgi:hypothetical protein